MATTDTEFHEVASARRKLATVPVWDPFVRLFHWSLVAAVTVAAVTGFLMGAPWISVHAWAGTAMAALVVARIVWGFWGGTYARFSSFLAGPRAVIAHLRGVVSGEEGRHLGHNPAGGLMIFALIAVALALAATGAVALGGMLKIGPFAALANFAAGLGARQVHSLLAWMLLGLVGLHVAGAVFEGLRTRDNLVRAMVTGWKEARHGDHAAPLRAARPVLAALFGVVLIGGGAASLNALAARPAPGVPSAPLDATYAEECGDCHAPFHPSLLPADAWRALFAGLDDHFGENASLPAETVAALQAYVTANAAETFDTLPANVFRRTGAQLPYQITASPFWKRTHARIDDAVFRSPAVASRANCAACHGDAATGRFDPRRISIPKETTR